jgi:hypothetical protein
MPRLIDTSPHWNVLLLKRATIMLGGATASEQLATEEAIMLKAIVILIALVASTSIHAQPTSAWSEPNVYQPPTSAWEGVYQPPTSAWNGVYRAPTSAWTDR